LGSRDRRAVKAFPDSDQVETTIEEDAAKVVETWSPPLLTPTFEIPDKSAVSDEKAASWATQCCVDGRRDPLAEILFGFETLRALPRLKHSGPTSFDLGSGQPGPRTGRSFP
jgi:hypothetical protein